MRGRGHTRLNDPFIPIAQLAQLFLICAWQDRVVMVTPISHCIDTNDWAPSGLSGTLVLCSCHHSRSTGRDQGGYQGPDWSYIDCVCLLRLWAVCSVYNSHWDGRRSCKCCFMIMWCIYDKPLYCIDANCVSVCRILVDWRSSWLTGVSGIL